MARITLRQLLDHAARLALGKELGAETKKTFYDEYFTVLDMAAVSAGLVNAITCDALPMANDRATSVAASSAALPSPVASASSGWSSSRRRASTRGCRSPRHFSPGEPWTCWSWRPRATRPRRWCRHDRWRRAKR